MPWTVNPDHGYLERFDTGESIDAVLTLSTDVGGPVAPDASGNVDVTGTNVYSDGATLNTLKLNLQGTNHALYVGRGTNAPSASLGVGTDGQVLVAATGADPAFSTLTSSDGSITFTPGANSLSLQTNGSMVGQTITGNDLNPVSPSAGNWDIVTNASTALFESDGSSGLILDFSLSNLFIGSAGSFLTSFAVQNTGYGTGALFSLQDGDANTAIGYGALSSMSGITGCLNNTALGTFALSDLANGNGNIAIGADAGSSYTSNETENIVIGNSGVLGESSIIRIGDTQDDCYLAGRLITSSGRVVHVTSTSTTPYNADTTNFVLAINTSGGAKTVNLVASPTTGTTYRIKDASGNAGSNNITIVPAAGNIDGSGSYVISEAYGAVDLVYTGSQWSILSNAAIITGAVTSVLAASGSTASLAGSVVTIKSPSYSDIGSSGAAVKNTGEFITATCTRTFPASATLSDGDLFEYATIGAGILTLQAVGAQKIRIGDQISSAAGTVFNFVNGDSISLRFRASDQIFYATSVVGTWQLT